MGFSALACPVSCFVCSLRTDRLHQKRDRTTVFWGERCSSSKFPCCSAHLSGIVLRQENAFLCSAIKTETRQALGCFPSCACGWVCCRRACRHLQPQGHFSRQSLMAWPWRGDHTVYTQGKEQVGSLWEPRVKSPANQPVIKARCEYPHTPYTSVSVCCVTTRNTWSGETAPIISTQKT